MSHLAAIACLLTLLILGARGWWPQAPCFMAFLWLNCLQRGISLIDAPHARNDLWWNYVWTPAEVALTFAAVASAVEILILRTRYLDEVERFSWRMCCLLVPIGIVGCAWKVAARSVYAWVLYAREYVWCGIFICCWLLICFLWKRPVREPQGLKQHSYIFTLLAASHASIAPLNRLGYGYIIPQAVYQSVLIICCARWIIFAVLHRPHQLPFHVLQVAPGGGFAAQGFYVTL